MLVLLPPSDIGFINFHLPEKLASVLLHGLPDSVVHEPRRFLSHPYLLGKLDGRYALLARRQEIDSDEPFLKGNLALSEDGPGLDGEILVALGAAEPLALGEAIDAHVAAMRAILSVPEADGFKMLLASFLCPRAIESVFSPNAI
jgi:hypothetical protein